MNKYEVFKLLKRTTLTGLPSEDYEEGFWDCYRQILENFELHFKNTAPQTTE